MEIEHFFREQIQKCKLAYVKGKLFVSVSGGLEQDSSPKSTVFLFLLHAGVSADAWLSSLGWKSSVLR